MSPEEITVAHPGLTLSDVYAALAYYHDHRDEIRGFLAQEEAIAADLEAQQPSLLEKIVARQNARGEAIAADLEAHLLSLFEKIVTRANAQNDPVPPG